MQQAKLSSKFQLSIPKSIRDDMRLHAGQKFAVVARGSVIELIPIKNIKDARGMLPLTQYDSADYRDRQDRY
jgi:AbrB family looped-hinge helix DNA binding protein